MRLVYARDDEGRLVERIDGGVAGTPLRLAVLDDDTEGAVVTLPRSQPRLERDTPARPAALVVDDDPDMRIMMRRILEAEGYTVVTCPGPGATHCEPARRGPVGTSRCARVPAQTQIVLLGDEAARTRLPEAYGAWLPDAEIR